ncbi:MAG TPA: aromatic amino acid ammonia-lyase [Puia sp.]|jgi:histidine ammonia-lyase|nr:aromatic amino acid ammonia-lyase [Puia sp.]
MIVVGQKPLILADFSEILYQKKEFTLDEAALEKVAANFRFLAEFSADKLIYGINTGFGPMAQYKVGEANLLELQYNLIRSHCSGSGNLLPAELVKATMITRLNSLMQAYSGVHPDTVILLQELIGREILPCIYEHGGVGASGDLVQLAHLGLTLIGEGEVLYEGAVQRTADVFARFGIRPLSIRIREGLAILNGTSAMTGIGLVNILRARRLVEWAAFLSALTNEIVSAFDDHYSYELNIVKHHPGQNRIAAMIRDILKGSGMIRSRTEHLYHPGSLTQEVFEEKVQEYYSLRCVTQVLGPVYDTVRQAEKVLVDELNSVNDNPVVDHENNNIFHGGNFHGDYVALEMDKLRIAITKLSMLAERQLNYLLNDRLNRKFPPFVNLGTLGLNFGMQGVQFTATSTVAENQTLSFPMYVHSIPNNNDNQDIVSMGANAALLTKKVIDNSFEVLSIQLMSVVQAVDSIDCVARLAPATRVVYDRVREIFPTFVDDHPKYKEQKKVKEFLEHSSPLP